MKDVNGRGIKRVALLNDLSCFGKCSLTVSIPIISSYGIETVPLPTAIFSTHTSGFDTYVFRDLTEEMIVFAAHWKNIGLKFDCIYTGFLCSTRQISFAQEFIREFCTDETLVVVDPVLGNHGGLYPSFSTEMIEPMKELAQAADVITPNHTEASLLSGMPLDTPDKTLLAMLPGKARIITSAGDDGHTGYIADFGSGILSIEQKKVDRELYGAGDVFTSALCGELMSGQKAECALYRAASFCGKCIQDTEKKQPAHWYGLWFEEAVQSRKDMFAEAAGQRP